MSEACKEMSPSNLANEACWGYPLVIIDKWFGNEKGSHTRSQLKIVVL